MHQLCFIVSETDWSSRSRGNETDQLLVLTQSSRTVTLDLTRSGTGTGSCPRSSVSWAQFAPRLHLFRSLVTFSSDITMLLLLWCVRRRRRRRRRSRRLDLQDVATRRLSTKSCSVWPDSTWRSVAVALLFTSFVPVQIKVKTRLVWMSGRGRQLD